MRLVARVDRSGKRREDRRRVGVDSEVPGAFKGAEAGTGIPPPSFSDSERHAGVRAAVPDPDRGAHVLEGESPRLEPEQRIWRKREARGPRRAV